MPGEERLLGVLTRSRELGFLGPGEVSAHIAHSQGLAQAYGRVPRRFVDLGSGGGVPGLVLAGIWPDAQAVLLDAQERRCRFLVDAIDALELAPRVTVVCQRAEEAARAGDLRECFDLVVARSFGPPSVTAECAVGLLRVGGVLVVSEPPGPDSPGRWPSDGLDTLGFGGASHARVRDASAAVMDRVRRDDRWPRRVGIPAKRPLWKAD